MHRYRMDRLSGKEEVLRILLLSLLLFLLVFLVGLLFSFTPQDLFPFARPVWSFLALYLSALVLATLESLWKRGGRMDGYAFEGDALVAYRGKRKKAIPLSSVLEITHVYGLDSLFGLDAVVIEGKGKSVTLCLRKAKASLFYKWLADSLDSGNDFKDDLLALYERELGEHDADRL